MPTMASETEPTLNQRYAVICIDPKNDTVDVPNFVLEPNDLLAFYKSGRYLYVDPNSPDVEPSAFSQQEVKSVKDEVDLAFKFGTGFKVDVLASAQVVPNLRITPRVKHDFSVYSPTRDYYVFVGTRAEDIELRASTFFHHLSQAQTSVEETPFRPDKSHQWFVIT